MKSLPKSTFIIISLFFLSLSASCSDKTSYLVEAIEDGDTIVINFKGKSQRIQLSGIDAPENTVNAKLNLDTKVKKISKEAQIEMGDLATDFLKSLVAVGQKVELQGDLSQPDKYGRIPAIVINEKGKSLNTSMVEAGYAIILTRYPLAAQFKETLEKAQQHAISSGSGLWGTHKEVAIKWRGK